MVIESMQKEIDKSLLKGIAASPGIVIGKAYVFHDILRPERHMILPHPKR
jgi:phosphoenolpyruvate synthase/pyruvate phosphate dikinase